MTRSVTESDRGGSTAVIRDRNGPDSPAGLSRASWVYVVRKTLREFSRDQCTDLAAALTYYAVLALFPAAIALLSLVGLFGQGPKTLDTLMNIVSGAGGSSAAQTLRPTLETLSHTQAAGAGLFFGLLVTFVVVVLAAVAMLTLIVSGPLVQSLGDALGLGSTAVLVWSMVKWPVLLLAVVVIVATLYYATPNVKQAKFRWLSVGAVVAIVLWAIPDCS